MYRQDPQFLIVMTNYSEQPQNHHYHNMSTHAESFLRPMRIDFDRIRMTYYEHLLQETVRLQLQDIIRYYLQNTRRTGPFYFLCDMSNNSFFS